MAVLKPETELNEILRFWLIKVVLIESILIES